MYIEYTWIFTLFIIFWEKLRCRWLCYSKSSVVHCTLFSLCIQCLFGLYILIHYFPVIPSIHSHLSNTYETILMSLLYFCVNTFLHIMLPRCICIHLYLCLYVILYLCIYIYMHIQDRVVFSLFASITLLFSTLSAMCI